MKTTLFTFALLLLLALTANAQQMRYFEFKTECGYNEWRDTSFIVATSDAAVIADVLNDLTKHPFDRKLIIGNIAHGNGGFNRNATFQFNWHFVPNEWHLQQLAMEVCDGCPYSDIELNPTYWLDQIREFCPWTSHVAREVTHLLGSEEPKTGPAISFYPNPATDLVTVQLQPTAQTELRLLNQVGQTVRVVNNSAQLPVAGLPAGLYYLQVKQGQQVQLQKLVVE